MKRQACDPQERLRKAADIAADEIRRQIHEGFLALGQRLIEAEMMGQIAVGRSTLREAYLKLAADGLEGFAAGRAATRVTLGSNPAHGCAKRAPCGSPRT